MKAKVSKYSDEFWIRNNSLKKINKFDSISGPRIEGFKIIDIVQYNPKDQHFRVVKNYGKNINILDGDEVTILKEPSQDERWKLVN